MRDPEGRVDPSLSRDPQRAPMRWSADAGRGFTDGEPWLPFAAGVAPVDEQAADTHSMLSLTRALLAARRASPALHEGGWEPLEAPADVIAYRRRAGDDERVVLLNLGDEPAVFELTGEWAVELATGPGGADPVGARTGVLLRPARSE
jgi:alpha-glucosidase